jgi:hypothetical protein
MRIITICIPAVVLAAASHAQSPAGNSDPGYRIIGAGITGASQLQPDAGKSSKLELDSPDVELLKAFDRAKRQATAYARGAGDPVGPWYEGAEPGRESFCMRDISPQAMGGHVLGLDRHNVNMVRHFAIDDPVFLNFYDRTVADYVVELGPRSGHEAAAPVEYSRPVRPAGQIPAGSRPKAKAALNDAGRARTRAARRLDAGILGGQSGAEASRVGRQDPVGGAAQPAGAEQ